MCVSRLPRPPSGVVAALRAPWLHVSGIVIALWSEEKTEAPDGLKDTWFKYNLAGRVRLMSELNRISSCTGRLTRAKLSSISFTLATGHGSRIWKSLDDEQDTTIWFFFFFKPNFRTANHQHVHTYLLNKTKASSDNSDNQGKADRLFFQSF